MERKEFYESGVQICDERDRLYVTIVKELALGSEIANRITKNKIKHWETRRQMNVFCRYLFQSNIDGNYEKGKNEESHSELHSVLIKINKYGESIENDLEEKYEKISKCILRLDELMKEEKKLISSRHASIKKEKSGK